MWKSRAGVGPGLQGTPSRGKGVILRPNPDAGVASHPSHRPRTSSTDETLAFNLPPSSPSPQLRAGPWDVGACAQRSQARALTGAGGGGSHAGVTCSGKAAWRKRPPWEAGGMRLLQDSGQHLAGGGPGPRHPVHSQDPPRSRVTGVWVQAREGHPRAERARGSTRTRPRLALLAFAVAVVHPHQDEWSWQGRPGPKAQQLWGQPCTGVCGSPGAPLGISRVLAGSRRLTPTKDGRKGP